eukprot:356780-Chlamydomonas_euryale.AAC.1
MRVRWLQMHAGAWKVRKRCRPPRASHPASKAPHTLVLTIWLRTRSSSLAMPTRCRLLPTIKTPHPTSASAPSGCGCAHRP